MITQLNKSIKFLWVQGVVEKNDAGDSGLYPFTYEFRMQNF